MVGIRDIGFNPQGARLGINGIGGAGYFPVEIAVRDVLGLNLSRSANLDITGRTLRHIDENPDGIVFYHAVKRRRIGSAIGNQIADIDMALGDYAVIRRIDLLELGQYCITVDNRLIEADLRFRLV